MFTAGLALGVADTARAACGDSVVDQGEQCDDGNVLDGDCCSATCEFEPLDYVTPCDHGRVGVCWSGTRGICDGAGECLPLPPIPAIAQNVARRFDLRDVEGTDRDVISWKLRKGPPYCYHIEPGGDPSVDTTYAFCIWSTVTYGPSSPSYLDELIYENVVLPGAGWEQSAKGWDYRLRNGRDLLEVRARRYSRFRAKGAYAALPGPVDAAQYFDSQIVLALVSSAGFGDFFYGTVDRNTAEQYKASAPLRCD